MMPVLKSNEEFFIPKCGSDWSCHPTAGIEKSILPEPSLVAWKSGGSSWQIGFMRHEIPQGVIERVAPFVRLSPFSILTSQYLMFLQGSAVRPSWCILSWIALQEKGGHSMMTLCAGGAHQMKYSSHSFHAFFITAN
jgi:hypothetical protein